MGNTKQVVIVGGGFAGINAARKLSNKPGVHVLLLDRRNHHLFQPLLYQVGTAVLEPADIASPIRSVFRHSANVDVLLANVTSVNLETRKVITDREELDYDYLVLACGSTHSYFGHDEWEGFAPGLKSLEEALEIRRRLLSVFERAERETDPTVQRELLTFVVVGAGPTGVELAGAIAEISRHTMGRDFRNITPGEARIYLIEGGQRILPTFDRKLSEYAHKALGKLGVTVKTNSIVTEVHDKGVAIGTEAINARTVLWAAGVQASELGKTLGVPLDRSGRVIVGPDCSIPDHPEAFVVGDQAAFEVGAGHYLPGVATVAIQQGKYVARQIAKRLTGETRRAFGYWDKGSMATIGRAMAVLQTGRIRMSGILAWYGWLLIHIYYLIGFQNRSVVLLQWTFNYLTMGRRARIILNPDWRSPVSNTPPYGSTTSRSPSPNS